MKQKRRGVATVELAVLLPLFMLIFLGMLEFGQLIRIQQRLTNASATGARYAVDDEATDDQVRLAANAAFWGLKDPSDGLTWANVNCQTPEALRVSISGLSVQTGQPVQVSLSVYYRDAVWAPMLDKLIPDELTAATTMAKEGVSE